MKEARKTVVEPRSEYVMVRTTRRLKKRLQTLADRRGLSLSLVGHLAFEVGLQAMEEQDAGESNL